MAMPLPGPVMLVAVLVTLGAGLAVRVGGPIVLRRLPEPQAGPDAGPAVRAEYEAKIDYRSLAGGRFVRGVSAAALLAMAIAIGTQPPWSWGCWFVFGTAGVLLAGIDAVTSWLPSILIYFGWAAMGAALLLAVVLSPGGRLRLLGLVLAGAAIAGLGFLGLWLATAGRSMAFGDVRLMPLVGAVAGTMGWAGLYWSILLGSVIGALIGIIRLAAHRPGPFPYAPALVSGPYAAALILSLF